MKSLREEIRCKFCGGLLEINSRGKYENITGITICSFSPSEFNTADHQPVEDIV